MSDRKVSTGGMANVGVPWLAGHHSVSITEPSRAWGHLPQGQIKTCFLEESIWFNKGEEFLPDSISHWSNT